MIAQFLSTPVASISPFRMDRLSSQGVSAPPDIVGRHVESPQPKEADVMKVDFYYHRNG
jgi:hypothetical protein